MIVHAFDRHFIAGTAVATSSVGRTAGRPSVLTRFPILVVDKVYHYWQTAVYYRFHCSQNATDKAPYIAAKVERIHRAVHGRNPYQIFSHVIDRSLEESSDSGVC